MTEDKKKDEAKASEESPETKKKTMSKGKKLLLGIIGGFLVVVVGGGLLAYTSTKEAASQTRDFVDQLVVGNYETAHGYFSEGLKGIQSLEVFEASFEGAPFDDTCNFTTQGVGTSSGTDGSARTITGKIECDSGDYESRFVFVDEDGEEKIEQYEINPAGVPLSDSSPLSTEEFLEPAEDTMPEVVPSQQ